MVVGVGSVVDSDSLLPCSTGVDIIGVDIIGVCF